MANQEQPRRVLKPGRLYFGDNWIITCADHAGSSALHTGYTISGLKVVEATEADKEAWLREVGEPMKCEGCP